MSPAPPVAPAATASEPSSSRPIRTLKDGYWDRTEVIELPDGSRRVRKRNKGTVAPGPWGIESLRREIGYLKLLPPALAPFVPPVLASWEREISGQPDLGYEMPFYAHHFDAGSLARDEALDQGEIDQFQRDLAAAVLNLLHQPMPAERPLSQHILETVRAALDGLAASDVFGAVIEAPHIILNNRKMVGSRAMLARLEGAADLLEKLDQAATVRIHGDFFLENILWRPAALRGKESQLILIDPVSVAGIYCAPPLFDLVKYESYATGELWALRTERIDVDGFGLADKPYRYSVRWDDPDLQPFRKFDWHKTFRREYEKKYGKVDERLYHLLDGYFSIAMALNTVGTQRQGRLLKATAEFNAALS